MSVKKYGWPLLLFALCFDSKAQVKTYLYNNADTAQGYVLAYKCSRPAKAAVLICPGGGYSMVAMQHEGIAVAQWLNQAGIDAYVLRYRVGTDSAPHRHPEPLNDVKAAMALIKQTPYTKTGILGFSAGAHLAGLYATDAATQAQFAILIYPVITSDSFYHHRWSFQQLLGKGVRQDSLNLFSIEKRVTAKTPPLWLLHCKDDDGVPYQNSELLYNVIKKRKPASRLLLFNKGGHGFGMNPVNPETNTWKAACLKWVKEMVSW
jgi:acetyl esterase/lipase